MRIAVTGASGFVGGALCRVLAEHGDKVHAFDRRAWVGPDHTGGATIRYWDIANGPLAEPPPVDAVVHVAAYVGDGFDELARRINVVGTGNVARSFPDARFVHVSSCSVYDPHHAQVNAAEDEAPAPDTVRWPNVYGRTKAEAERLLREIRPDAVVLRPHAVYGPGDTTLLPRIRAAVRRGTLTLPGDGTQLHSVTHVHNLAAACRLGAGAGAPPGTYNVSDPEPVRITEAMAQLATRDGRVPRVRTLPVAPLLAVGTAIDVTRRLTGRPKNPPVTAYTVEHLALERTFDITAARTHLAYTPFPTTTDGVETW